MRTKLPLILSAMALVIAVGATGGPAVAHGVRHALFAHNADKVDGRHAVGYAATFASRKGKLVATSPTTGRVHDAERLDGLDSSAFIRGQGETFTFRDIRGGGSSYTLPIPDFGTLTGTCISGSPSGYSLSLDVPNANQSFRLGWASVDGAPPTSAVGGVSGGPLALATTPGPGGHQTVFTLWREDAVSLPRPSWKATVEVSSLTLVGNVCYSVVHVQLVRGQAA